MRTLVCPSCQAENHASCRFCIACGADLPEAPASPAPLSAPERTEADPAQATVDRLRAIIAELGYEAGPIAKGWRVKVPVAEDRHQRLYVQCGGKDADGDDVVSFFTVCGAADEDRAGKLLRCNAKLAHGAFAFKTIKGREYVVATATQLARTADAEELKKLLRQLARTGDAMEVHLGGAEEDLF